MGCTRSNPIDFHHERGALVDGDCEQARIERERRLFEVGGLLLAQAARERTWSERWIEKLVAELLADADIKVRVLRFIDVLPTLDDAGEVARHVREYFLEDEAPITAPIKRLIGLAEKGPAALAHGVRLGLARVAGRYIVSADWAKMLAVVRSLRNTGRGFSLDLLGEAVLSDAEADDYLRNYLQLIEALPGRLQAWPAVARLDDVDGRPGPRLYLSIKLSSLYPWIDALDPEGGIAGIVERLRPLLLAARRQRVFVCFDMEQYDCKAIVLASFKTLLMEPGLRDWADVGIALQAYLRETEGDLAELIAWAGVRACPVTVRLVRGAYWDYETVIAAQSGWPAPVWGRKEETDLCYERCLQRLFDAYPVVRAAVASHNPRSLALAMVLAEQSRLRSGDFEFQMLYGMAEPLQRAVVAMGHRLRIYLPCGDAIPGMAYLVRRLLENSSSQSLERMSLMRLDLPERLLSAPVVPVSEDGPVTVVPEGPAPFRNEPVYRFTDPGERKRFAEAIARAGSPSPAIYPLVIDGQPVDTGDYSRSVNPARPHDIVGRVAIAGPPEADRAIAGAARAFRSWSRLPATARVAVMRKAAALLRERRDEFAALEILEAGKTWREADANVTEAIDYLEFYARQALRLAAPENRDVAGEADRLGYRPLGVGVILPPWNFPLAILVGMLSAAVVTGNTVLLKPSSLTPVIAARLVGLLQEAGIPPGVVQFVPGPGHAVGEYLVQHSGVHFIAFTGSREVGARILQLAAEIAPGQRHIKRVVAEMGGKNAMIIDRDADPDEAILGILHSAFGYQGQKCSACSRVIVVGPHHDALVRRLSEAARGLRIGDPAQPGVFMGPVIDERARMRIEAVIEEAGRYAECALRVDTSRLRPGYFVGPAIFKQVPPESPLAREEVFGPVLATMQARDLDEALAIANDSEYALTGGFYSRSPGNIEQVRREFEAGNLYVNRKITGALVGRQPFGGFKLSGYGTKAGGEDYLRQFLVPVTYTERTLRRGYAPESGQGRP
jgi:RHH-type proline utilization regulon transcriptional repressor/proline dehydrogenase/delta 1-pyrroline-5-carboxylate dehydrogenase